MSGGLSIGPGLSVIPGGVLAPTTNNTAFGLNALSSLTTGYLNSAYGFGALQSLTSGYGNNAFGALTLRDNTTGVENQAFGYRALLKNVTGFQNTALGSNAMYENIDGNNNVAVGMYALHDNVGVNGVNGYSNVAIGFSALHFNVDGYSNTALGYYAMRNPTTGVENVAIGALAFPNMLSGSNNIGLGFNVGGGITTGSRNTIIGGNVTGLAAALSDTVIIATGNNSVRFFSDSAGLTGIGTSSPAAKLQVTGGDLYVSSGALGIATNSLTGYVVRLNKTITGATIAYGVYAGGSVQSDVTSQASFFRTHAVVANSAFTLPNLYHYNATQSTIGASATVTNQFGFYADDTILGATTNYQFYAANAAAVGAAKTVYSFYSAANTATGGGTTWGFYGAGTAPNRFNSDLLIYGGTAIPAGGTAGAGLKFSSTANFGVFFGSGAPTLSAAKGSFYLRSDGSGTTDRAYIATNSSGTWTALTTVA